MADHEVILGWATGRRRDRFAEGAPRHAPRVVTAKSSGLAEAPLGAAHHARPQPTTSAAATTEQAGAASTEQARAATTAQ